MPVSIYLKFHTLASLYTSNVRQLRNKSAGLINFDTLPISFFILKFQLQEKFNKK